MQVAAGARTHLGSCRRGCFRTWQFAEWLRVPCKRRVRSQVKATCGEFLVELRRPTCFPTPYAAETGGHAAIHFPHKTPLNPEPESIRVSRMFHSLRRTAVSTLGRRCVIGLTGWLTGEVPPVSRKGLVVLG